MTDCATLARLRYWSACLTPRRRACSMPNVRLRSPGGHLDQALRSWWKWATRRGPAGKVNA